ncbi:putative tRNA (cytosine(34)-C(5))-methyltransferase [Helianthus annuus]|uniref:tRNA (Cytosine(34)-C(5))-methyltransferase n=1 Tax=Helianthus annuus TaxID=4232 RepID=A0A9K3MX91_HELAN|nr:multisite-specific tRNA:(cytosine-C(5))-methyltransferase [Helianthus annuus]KAF5779122.1 putative tRNA (cytosine(34)-C(5))-methyltransferase [Helianthus annuus]KAJ0490434.1 putative tRNA (cytosine(34)-C(5))-methyltransferase [Helianthus annuus]KAJ0494639.1 putative tRNA (cytosine(34)-C(5))-methyltransferase [Helianthus annuus]KAJ0506352.1 putative tRNA (cytosine(34)-C(5))-methyltransferase [Helianthus annuus]KAJ0676028.1 putative tRNA (cytosine(34)-C(5))-methyltransferase [Helianthus annuu
MGGRGRSRRTQRKHFRDGRENVWKNNNDKSEPQQQNKENNNWQPFVAENAAFNEYYKEQGIVRPEEWDAFMECLRNPLPSAFRINSSSQFSMDLKSQLQDEFSKSLQIAGEAEGIKSLPWYPDNFAWQSSFSRMQLRKNKSLERFHEFLKQENEIGNITRQEAVSMVPPLFLDVHRDHFVIDLCAAPGSKTFQLLEMIHQASDVGSLPSGMVVANDVDVQRCNLLIHQTKRMCTANLVVTNHEAQHFPSCHMKKNHENVSELGMTQLLFDRVLCDVPCSGDGTLRKAPDIWRKWSVGMANGVHCLQLQIAMRGLALLRSGGRMVYSTCSMNPVENEAVVSEILRRCGGSVELVDVSTELPQLIRRPGLKSWKVRDKGVWLASHKDACKHGRSGIVPSMFPSGQAHLDTSDDTNENPGAEIIEDGNSNNGDVDVLVPEVSSLPLERCMRFVPHDQNTGAFFVAVFHKISQLPVLQTKSNKHSRERDSDSDEKVKQGEDKDVNETDVSNADAGVLDEKAKQGEDKDVNEEAIADAGVPVKESDEELLDCNPSKKLRVESPNKPKSRAEKANDKRKLQIQGKWFGVDPVVFFEDDAILTGIKEFYGIKESFPFNHHLITRNSDTNHVKRIYYISESVKNVVELNFLAGEQLKITSIGLKMFERQTSREGVSTACVFRISSEGLPLLLPHMTKQIACASPADFKHLLQYKSIKFPDLVDDGFREKVSTLSLGCCVVVLNKDNEGSSDPPVVDRSTIAIGCWKGRSSLSVMVTAIDCQEMLERLLVRFETKSGSSDINCEEAANVDDAQVKDVSETVTTSDDVEVNKE